MTEIYTEFFIFTIMHQSSTNYGSTGGVSSCKGPIELLTLDEIADRCHAPDEVWASYSKILLCVWGFCMY